LKSLQEVIDTTSPSGKLTFHIFAALAEFARQLRLTPLSRPQEVLNKVDCPVAS